MCLLQAKATINLSLEQEEIDDLRLKELFFFFFFAGGILDWFPAVVAFTARGLEGLLSTSASLLLHCLCDLESQVRASKSDEVGHGSGTPGSPALCLGLVCIFCRAGK